MIHFWDNIAALGDLQLVNQPVNQNNENTTQNAWAAVLHEIFPNHETVQGQSVRWRILREAYRGPPGQEWMVRPDIVTLKVTDAPAQPGQPAAFDRHDRLIIENKAAVHNTASEWRDLLIETTTRLQSFCANHDIHVICTVGLRYMLFYWNPALANQPQIALRGRVQGAQQDYVLPSQLRPLPPAPHVPNMQALGPQQFMIDHTRALNINPDPVNNILSLQAMEQFLAIIRTTALVQPHPVNN